MPGSQLNKESLDAIEARLQTIEARLARLEERAWEDIEGTVVVRTDVAYLKQVAKMVIAILTTMVGGALTWFITWLVDGRAGK